MIPVIKRKSIEESLILPRAALVSMLVLAVLGQIEFSFFKDLDGGMILYAGSFICFAALFLITAERHGYPDGDAGLEARFPIDFRLLVASLLLFILLIYQASQLSDNFFSLLVWLASLILYGGSFIRPDWCKVSGKNGMVSIPHWLIPAGIIVLAAFLRLYCLGTIPLLINQEEGFASRGALDVLYGELKGVFQFGPKTAGGWTYYSGLYFYGHAFFMKLAGVGVFGNRLFAAVAGILTVCATMGLTRRLYDRKTACIAGLLAAVLGIQIHFSRFGFPFIHNALWGAIALYGLVLAEQKRTPFYFALAGMVTGIAQYTWSAARLLPVLALCFFGMKALFEKGYLKRYRRHLLVFGMGFLVAFLPLVVPFQLKLPNFFEGVKRDFIFGGFMSEFKDQKIGPLGYLDIIPGYLLRAFLEFNFFPDKGYCYAGPGPMLPMVTSIFFAIGLFQLLLTWKKPGSTLLLLAFFGTMIGLVALTTYPPNYQRAVVILALPPIIAALGIRRVLDLTAGVFRIPKPFLTAGLAILLAFLAWENYHDYFDTFTRIHNAQLEKTTRIGLFVQEQDPSLAVYIPNPPMHTPWVLNLMSDRTRSVSYPSVEGAIASEKGKPNHRTMVILMEWNVEQTTRFLSSFPGSVVKDLPGDPSVKVLEIR